jgi:SAM-dependent methyltransferase
VPRRAIGAADCHPLSVRRFASSHHADAAGMPVRKLRPFRSTRLICRSVSAMGHDASKIAKVYDDVAKAYAEKFCGEHEKKPQDREILRRFSREVEGKKPVWDFGCGPGQTTRYLKNLGVDISGLDLSRKLIDHATTIHPGIPFRTGDLLDLEFEDESIGGVVAFYAIVHFSEKQVKRAFHETFRVLQPGGVFLLTYHIGEATIHLDEFLGKEVDIDFMFFSTEFISRCLQDAGFERIEVIERDPYPEVEYQSRRAYVFARKPAAERQP